MNPQRWEELSARLAEALESPDPASRIAASGDPDLAELFAWHRRAGDFLEERPERESPWVGRRIDGRYPLNRVLGRGGAGVVFEAGDEQVAGRRVVIKLLHDFWSSEDWMRRRFREEAAVLTRLDHPGIVRLIDAGEIEDGRLFLVLPFHEGRTLRDALAAGPLDGAFAARRPAPVTAFTAELADNLQAGALDSRLARLWVRRRSRRFMLASGATALVGAAAGGWWLRDWLTPLDAAERVIDFPRGDSAEMAGFSIHRELTERAIRDFPGGATRAMRYLTPDQGTLYKRLTSRQQEWAFRRGWKVSALCRPESGHAGVGVENGTSPPAFVAVLQATRDRVELIAVKQVRDGLGGIRAPLSLPPAPTLMRLEMAYDPVSARATVSVDGQILIRDYAGHTEYRGDHTVFFAVASKDGSMASAVFGGLRFEILG